MTKIQCPNCKSYDTINQFEYIGSGIGIMILSVFLMWAIPLLGVPFMFFGGFVLAYGLAQKWDKKTQRQIRCKNCDNEFPKPKIRE